MLSVRRLIVAFVAVTALSPLIAAPSAVADSGTSTAATSTPNLAQESPAAIASDFECGFLRCSYVFSKRHTNAIANDGLAAAGLCGLIPTPGNGVCVAGFSVLVLTAKVAKSRGQCLKYTWVKVYPHPSYPSVEGGSRCK
jgi:hypothetical protein